MSNATARDALRKAAADIAAANYAAAAADHALAAANDAVAPAVDNVADPPPSRFKNIVKALKYISPSLIILAPIWLLGGFSGLGVGSPVGLNVC